MVGNKDRMCLVSTLLGGLKQSQVHTKVAKHSKVALQQSLTCRQLAVI